MAEKWIPFCDECGNSGHTTTEHQDDERSYKDSEEE